MREEPGDQAKWDRIYAGDRPYPEPARVLSENAHLLPRCGAALDFACGLGGNALFLASRGLTTHAWDISPIAIRTLERFARESGVSIQADVRDVETEPLAPQGFDVVVVSRFLERRLAGSIMRLLSPGGLLFYQTFTRTKAAEAGPRNPAYLLGDNELLRLFAALHLCVYREEGLVGDVSKGFRNEAMLVGQRV
jgi:tellurite methyltransferase